MLPSFLLQDVCSFCEYSDVWVALMRNNRHRCLGSFSKADPQNGPHVDDLLAQVLRIKNKPTIDSEK